MIYEFEGKTERDAIDKAIAELGVESDQFDVEIVEIQKNSLFKKGYAKIRVHIDDKATVERPTSDTPLQSGPGREAATDKEADLVKFIGELIHAMGYTANIEILSHEEHKLLVRLSSEDSAILIGKKGKNLDAIAKTIGFVVKNRWFDLLIPLPIRL